MSASVRVQQPGPKTSRSAFNRLRTVSSRVALVLALSVLVPTGVVPWRPTPAVAQEAPTVVLQPAARTLSVSASVQTGAYPDMATIRAGVLTEAETAVDAVERNSSIMKKVFRSLEQAGIANKDVSTSDFEVNPKYRERDNQTPKLVGYTVSNIVTVRVRALDTLGATLDRMVDAGVNQVNGIDFIVSKADELLDEARKSAVADARRKAEIYAAAAGVELGSVVSINEGGHSGGFASKNRVQSGNNNSVSIAIGQQTLDVQVSVVWALK
jgi:uncharacterized protein